MKRFKQKPIRLVESELKTDLGMGNFIFVGSSCDMFAEDIPDDWILRILDYCKQFSNRYLFQSKNPERMTEFSKYFPENTVLGTTIETNREELHYNAPDVSERQFHIQQSKFPVMVTIEPIMDFDLEILVAWIKDIKPDWVNIGADSKGHNLPEPNKEKIEKLIEELKKFTEVKIKSNLNRLMK